MSRAARLLGFAGLLPPIAALALIAMGRSDPTDLAWIPLFVGYGLAMIYAAVILSFLGGIWWGFAMRRDDGQGRLAALAVLPSLVAVALVAAAGLSTPAMPPWPLVGLGCAVLLTLLVDRHLVHRREAPAGWMTLRVPLSIGLGLETIAAGILVAV